MYDPSSARFLSKDPLEESGGSPNLYLYCANDPVNKTDPSGRYLIADDAALGPWLRGLQMAGVDAASVPLSGAVRWNQRHYIDVPKTDEQRQKLRALVQRWYGGHGASFVDHVYRWIASGEIGHVDAIGEGITHRTTSELADGWIEEILKFSYARQGVAVNYTTEKFGLLKGLLSALDCARAAGGVVANIADLATGIPAGLEATGAAAFSGAIDEVFGGGRWSQSLLGAVLDWAGVDRGWAQLIDNPNRDQVLTAVFRQLGFTADALFGKTQYALGGNVTTLLWTVSSLDGALGGATDVDAVSKLASKWALDLGRTVDGFDGALRQAIDEVLSAGKAEILEPVVTKMYTQFFVGAVTRAIPIVGWVFGLIKGLVGAIRVLGNLCGMVESLRTILNDWLNGRAGQQQLQAAMVKLLRDGLKTLVQFVAHQINLGGVPAIIQKGLEGVKAAAQKPVDKVLEYAGRAWNRTFEASLPRLGLGQQDNALTNPVRKAADGRDYRLWVDRKTRHPMLRYNPDVNLHNAVNQAGAGSCLAGLKVPVADVEQHGHKLAATLTGPPKLTATAAGTVPHQNSALVGAERKLLDNAANCGVCALPGGGNSPTNQSGLKGGGTSGFHDPAFLAGRDRIFCHPCSILRRKKTKDLTTPYGSFTAKVEVAIGDNNKELSYAEAGVSHGPGRTIDQSATKPVVCKVHELFGTLMAKPVNGTTRGNWPQALMRELLITGNADPAIYPGKYDAGHLIGLQFGGPDSVYALVPMEKKLNQDDFGSWKSFENKMRNCLFQSDIQGATISVKVSYGNPQKSSKEFIPTQFDVAVLFSQAATGTCRNPIPRIGPTLKFLNQFDPRDFNKASVSCLSGWMPANP